MSISKLKQSPLKVTNNSNKVENIENKDIETQEIFSKLVDELLINYDVLEQELNPLNIEENINIRIKQYAIMKIIVLTYNGDKQLLIKSLYNLGSIYSKNNSYNQSTKHLNNALLLNEEEKDNDIFLTNQIKILQKICINYKKNKEFNKAISYCNQIIELYDKQNIQKDNKYYIILSILAETYSNSNNLKLSDDNLTECYNYYKRITENDKIEKEFINILNIQTKNLYKSKKIIECLDKINELLSYIEHKDLYKKFKTKYFNFIKKKIDIISNQSSRLDFMTEDIIKYCLKLKDSLLLVNGEKSIDSIKYLKFIFITLSKNKLFEAALDVIDIIEKILLNYYKENSKKMLNTYKEKAFILLKLDDKKSANKYYKLYEKICKDNNIEDNK